MITCVIDNPEQKKQHERKYAKGDDDIILTPLQLPKKFQRVMQMKPENIDKDLIAEIKETLK